MEPIDLCGGVRKSDAWVIWGGTDLWLKVEIDSLYVYACDSSMFH